MKEPKDDNLHLNFAYDNFSQAACLPWSHRLIVFPGQGMWPYDFVKSDILGKE